MKEISKQYNSKEVEDKIYAMWEKSGFFNPDNLNLPKNAKPYTIVLPPPNITDKLHLGHASIIAIEDLLIRYHRMKGFRALYLPGTDHASIATQNVVEKKLLKEQGLTRHDLGKEKFLEEVWKFLRVTQSTILTQARKMGGSFDWSREAFTLDEKRKKAVTKMFIDMYQEGLVYRGNRIVNWCPRCKSTLADDEMEYKEQTAFLYTFKYDANFPISISTTRPETKLGDTAVAVNPKDKRYKKYIGKTLEADFCGIKLKLKIIADRNVEMNFGTGALGVTPAHSMVDWEMAQKNDLEIIKVIDEEGKIREGFSEFSGKVSLEARKLIVAKLKELNLLEKEEELQNNLSVCYRCGTTIEPIPSDQWFLSVDKKLKRLGGKSLKEKALEVAKTGKIKFIPFRFTKRYTDWMANLHDWCISRQIWFGHEFPVWYRSRNTQHATRNNKDKVEIYVGEKAPKGKGWKKDADTFDTWFSSGMWTFSTLGWPDNYTNGKKSGDLAKFHPTQVLETGYEIITLWVSRMIMMSLFALKEIPFENVYLHGMVLDKFGKKMSKSKGNGIDPLDMIEKFGTDAVRMALLIGSTPGNDVRVSEEKIENYRNFVTKLWNIYRYCVQADNQFALVEKLNQKDLKLLSDKWIVSRTMEVSDDVTRFLNEYKFSLAGETLEKFIWDDFADWYVEINKIEKNTKVLGFVFDKILKLTHPFTPFITEKIYQDLTEGKSVLMVSQWPKVDKKFTDKKAKVDFENLRDIITRIRNIRSSYRIEPAKIIDVFGARDFEKEIIERLARVNVVVSKKFEKEKMIQVSNKKQNLYLDISNLIDVKKEKERLQKEVESLAGLVLKTEKMIQNQNYVKSAPAAVVASTRERVLEYKSKLKASKELLNNLRKI